MRARDAGFDSPFRAHARNQAGYCDRLMAPFTASLCRILAERIDPDSALGQRLDRWPGEPVADALVLRLTGGLHAAVLSGRSPALAAHYPPADADPDMLWRAVQPIIEAPDFAAWLDRAPQTNEVGRSGVLVPGMLVMADVTGLPLALFELGASAGLNLLPDRYALQLGGVRAGDQASPLAIAPDWKGGSPPAVPLVIADRIGVDLNPLCLPDDAMRMLAYIWPDQPVRLGAMRAAIAIAANDPPLVVGGDAAEFVEQRVWPKAGVATLVMHSIAFQYFSAATQKRISAHMELAGSAATAAAPIGWLRYEMSDPTAPAKPELRLRIWPGGDDRLLATGHPHGASVRWLL